jgi:D-3-phosphoglycerate dehydrogenase / 2-oxoglutarate reductase
MKGIEKILVTPRAVTRGGHPSLAHLDAAGYEILLSPAARQPTEEELIHLLPGCVGYLAGVEQVTQRVLDAAVDLRVISRNGTGVDSIDIEAAERRGIPVLRAEGANARAVAELAVGLMFALARDIPQCDRWVKGGEWKRGNGVELEEKTLGLVGCGRIGRAVAKMALGVGLKVVAYDAFPDESFAPSHHFRHGSLEEVLAKSDFLSFHCPPPSGGRPILDSAELAKMKRGSFLINTARHEVLDSEAVLAALDSGQLAGAALDVFDAEPPRDTRLARHPRIIATAHIGAFTRESVDRAMYAAVENLLRALKAK